MNNEPVAWMLVTGHGTKILEKKPYCEVDYWKPLYTHPVKEHDIGISHAIGFDDGFKAGMQRAVEMNVVKELTDAEIKAVYGEYFDVENCDWLHLECIRAILRKAQEK